MTGNRLTDYGPINIEQNLSMTKKHFIMLAGAIKETRDTISPENAPKAALDMLARRLCNKLRRDNPLFDEARFLKACGIEN